MGGVEKISSEHLARIACTYVRQSSPAQVRNNTESRELQYELVERAVMLGWTAERVRVINADLGISADSPNQISYFCEGERNRFRRDPPAALPAERPGSVIKTRPYRAGSLADAA